MTDKERLLDHLAGAVLDWSSVDWAAAESTADADVRVVVQQMQLLSAIARVHHETPPAGTPPDSAFMPTPSNPVSWGHFSLLEHVGRGGFGTVFRAWDTRLDREVALKLLPAGRARNQQGASSIIYEGRLLARVRHTNVVTIHGAEQIGEQIGLAMEFVRGQTLEELLRRGAAFGADEVIHIGLELARAVSAVHAAGLLHRDIKAQNVMRAEDGRIVLMDFGTGRELVDSSSSDMAGTPVYLAPEILAGGPATAQSDIYSLGVLLYHLVTGAYPVKGRTVREIREAHQRGTRRSLREIRPDTGARLAAAIDQAIDPLPERRYHTAEAFGASLLNVQRRAHRKPLLYGAAIVGSLAMAGVVSLMLPSDPSVPAIPASGVTAGVPASPREQIPAGDVGKAPGGDAGLTSTTANAAATKPLEPEVASAAGNPGERLVKRQRVDIRPSVQVLPPTNASGRSGDAWLSGALAEMLLREFRGAEAFRWIPGAVPLAKAQLGQALITQSSLFVRPVVPADIIVSGEYTVSGQPGGLPDGLRLTVKIDDTTTGEAPTVFSETGSNQDLPGLISRVGARARAALGVSALSPAQATALAASQPANAEAARAYAEALTKTSPSAVELLEQAVAADPRFAPAYIALAEGRKFRSFPACEESRPACADEQEKAKVAATKARELSVDLPAEERMLIEVRFLVATATALSMSAREDIFRRLYRLTPDTLLYGFETARGQLRTGHLTDALTTIDAISRLPGATEDVNLLDLEATTARLAKQYARAQRACERGAALARSVGDLILLGNIRIEQSWLALNLGEPAKALDLAEESLQHFISANASVNSLSAARASIVRALRANGDFERARATNEQMIASARNAEPAATQRVALARVAGLLLDHGDLSDSRTLWEELSRNWVMKPSSTYVRLPSTELGLVLYRQGELSAARQKFEETLIDVEDQHRDTEGRVRYLLARLLFEQGELALAREHAARSITLLTNQDFLMEAQSILARALMAAGDYAAAHQALEEAAERPRPGPPARYPAFDLAIVQALLALEEGKADASRAQAQWAVTLAHNDSRPDDEAIADSVLALAYLSEGAVARAQQASARVDKRIAITEDRLLRLSGEIAAARVRAAAAKSAAAVTSAKWELDTLSRDAAAIGAVAIAFEARLAVGELEIRTGDASRGREYLASLERDATAKGFVAIGRKAAALSMRPR